MALSEMLQPFMWGAGGQMLTPEQIARQRQIADALLSQAGDTSPVGHWTQGAARVVNALGGQLRNYRLDKAEGANAKADSGILASLLGGMGGGDFPAAPAVPEASAAADYPTQRVAQAFGDADPIRSGLIERGLPPHIADAFVMNFQDESGLNPGINEAAPIVPGSRGGFGLAQWTGPRRRALEAFAAERGAPVSDPDTQLDFLMTELQGPEAKAAQAIMSAPDTGTAAAAIVNNFLRPAPEHRARREARYLSSSGGAALEGQPSQTTLENMAVGETVPMQGAPVQIAQAEGQFHPFTGQPMNDAGPSGGINPAIMQALSSPQASDSTRRIAGMLLQQQFGQQQAEQERMRAAQDAEIQMRQRMQAAQAAGVDPRFIGDDEIWKQAASAQFRERPTDVREYEYARGQGYEGSFAQFQQEQKRAGATNVDARNMGSIPQGYRMVYDANNNPVSMEPIPGGPADTSATEAAAAENQSVSGDIIVNAARNARQIATRSGRAATGTAGRLLSTFGETDAAELRRQVDVLTSNAKVENLQAMRAASPTGGALGAVSDKENQMLAAKTGALDPNAGPEQFARALDDYERTLLRIIHGPKVGDAIFEQTREAAENKPVTDMSDEELEAIINGKR